MADRVEYFIDGDNEYEVTLDTDMEGHGEDSDERVTGCWILFQRRRGEDYTASLQCALDTGVLTSNSEREHKISNKVLTKIEQWAIENGY